MKEIDPDLVSVDWCDDEETVLHPHDETQFVKVRRLTSDEKRKRQSAGAKMSMGVSGKNTDTQDIDITVATDRIRMFEYERSITDYCLKDNRGNTLRFGAARDNARVYSHLNGLLAKAVDEAIERLNKDEAEVAEVSGNSDGSLPRDGATASQEA